MPEPLSFEWDKGNKDKNFRKHNVSIKDAEDVFNNEPKFFFIDKKHSSREKRIGLFGRTDNDRKLSIVFTVRGDKVRIITARDMSKKERSAYEKQIEKNS